MTFEQASDRRENERVLTLPFECLRSIKEGINEVRLWHDPYLDCERVGKRIDISGIEHDGALPEPSTLQMINHANVVPVLAAARVSGYYSPLKVVELITPYFPRGSITDALLRGETFTASEAVAIVQAALRGLGQMHEVHDIAHRDVKSGNILLADDASIAKIADLGLAGTFDASGEVPAVDNPTLYSPPEVADPKRLDRSSDLYPLALVLRELLGGHLPYGSPEYTTTAIVNRLMSGRSPVLPRDRELPIWTSKQLRTIIRKASQRKTQARFSTAREMDAALSRAVVVDWREVGDGRWEGPYVHLRGRRISVEARLMRSGKYRLITAVHQGKGWRRCTPDVDVPELICPEAREVFDHATAVASVR